MKAPTTLAALLEAQAEHRADSPAYRFLDRAANVGGGYSFRALCQRADAIASALQARGVGAGERVLIACNSPADFVPAFFAAMRSGAIAVPTPPPRSRQRRRFESIIDDCQPVAALMAADDARFLIGADSSRGCRRLIVLDPQLAHDEARLSTPALRPSDVAFLQYTSGSTGQPRGVKVTHGAALANLAMIQAAFRQDEDSGFVGWLPLFHDMGLIGNVLQPLYLGSTSVLMPPAAFLENPLRWLETISAVRAHTSGGPDFAYGACVRALAHAPAGWAPDLSAWRVAFNGAEPVRAATLEAFIRAFAPFGFQASAFLPCYGMAEATLLAAGAGRDQAPRMFDVDAGQLEGGRAEAAADGSPGARRLVSSGPATVGAAIAIVAAGQAQPLADGQVGEICLAGPHVARQYWGDGEGAMISHLQVDGVPHIRTGDLGFRWQRELYIVGRVKELIIVGGRNLHPHDLEDSALRTDAGVAACAIGVDPDVYGQLSHLPAAEQREHVVLLLEVEQRAEPEAWSRAIAAVRASVADEHALALDAIWLLRRGSIETTSSGKLRRAAMRDRLAAGDLRPLCCWHAQPGEARVEAALAQLAQACQAPAPQTAWTALLAELVAAMLDCPAPPPDQPLVALGLGSMAAMRLLQAIEQATGLSLPFTAAYGDADIASLARHLAAARADAPRQDQPSPPPASPSPLLSPPRQAVYLQRRVAGDRPMTLGFTLRSPARDAEPLVAAVRQLLKRYPALTEAYYETPAGLQAAPGQATLPLQKLRTSGAHETRQLLDRALDQGFELEQGPVRVLQMDEPGELTATTVLLHHVAVDFPSVALLAEQLVAIVRGQPAPSPLARRRQRAGTAPEAAMPVEGGPGLPPDLATGGRGHVQAEIALDVKRMGQLRASCGVSDFCLLLAALSLAVTQTTATQAPSITVPFALSRPDGAGAVGYHTHPVPLAVALPDSASFGDLCRGWAHTIGNVGQRLEAGLLPYPASGPRQISAVHLDAQPGLGPALAQLALGLEPGVLRLGEYELSNEVAQLRDTEIPLQLTSCGSGASLRAVLRMDQGFSVATVASLAQRMADTLARAAGSELLSLATLRQASAHEIGLTAGWGRGAPQPPSGVTLLSLFEEQVAARPQALALVFEEQQCSYLALHALAQAMARRIAHALGAGRAAQLGVLIDDPVLRTAAMLGVLMSGATLVLLDPSLPAARLQALCAASALDALLIDGAAPFADAPPLVHANGPAVGPVAVLRAARVDGDAPAYLVFTSGSTGAPKGIVQRHGAIARFVQWQAQALGIGPGARVAQIAAPGFDVALCEVFGALCVGAALCLPRRTRDIAPDRLLGWLTRDRVSVVQAIPSHLACALDADPAALALDCIATVGEPLSPALAGRLLQRNRAGGRLLNLYGPSETIAATMHEVGATDLLRARIPVGRPLAGRNVLVLSDEGKPVPLNQCGEIWIHSLDMANGYAFSPASEQQRFAALPDRASGRAGRYRTGDLGRWLSDGVLDIVGRRDTQVKLNGVRIELEAIEATLMSAPGVRACIAALVPAAAGRVVLGVLVQSAPPADVAALRRHCAAHLPHSQLPAIVVTVDAVPRLANGKADRAQAGALLAAHGALAAPAQPSRPLSPCETRVAAVWADYLRGGTPGPDTNFFELGGDSMLALQILNRLQDDFGIPLQLGVFLSNPTIASLARTIDAAGDPLCSTPSLHEYELK